MVGRGAKELSEGRLVPVTVAPAKRARIRTTTLRFSPCCWGCSVCRPHSIPWRCLGADLWRLSLLSSYLVGSYLLMKRTPHLPGRPQQTGRTCVLPCSITGAFRISGNRRWAAGDGPRRESPPAARQVGSQISAKPDGRCVYLFVAQSAGQVDEIRLACQQAAGPWLECGATLILRRARINTCEQTIPVPS